jgi:hypothetical protein
MARIESHLLILLVLLLPVPVATGTLLVTDVLNRLCQVLEAQAPGNVGNLAHRVRRQVPPARVQDSLDNDKSALNVALLDELVLAVALACVHHVAKSDELRLDRDDIGAVVDAPAAKGFVFRGSGFRFTVEGECVRALIATDVVVLQVHLDEGVEHRV